MVYGPLARIPVIGQNPRESTAYALSNAETNRRRNKFGAKKKYEYSRGYEDAQIQMHRTFAHASQSSDFNREHTVAFNRVNSLNKKKIGQNHFHSVNSIDRNLRGNEPPISPLFTIFTQHAQRQITQRIVCHFCWVQTNEDEKKNLAVFCMLFRKLFGLVSSPMVPMSQNGIGDNGTKFDIE